MALNDFKTFAKDRLQMEDLIELAAFGRHYQAEYEAQGITAPEFVKDNLATLTREIQSKVAEAKAARVKTIQNSLEGLKTSQERRAALEAELAKLMGAPVSA